MINFNIKTDGFWGFPHFKRHPCIHSSSFFDNIYIYPGENYLSDWPFLGRSLETKTINPQLYPTGVENPFVDFFFCDLVEDLVNPNCQKDVIPKNDGKMTMICFPIKKPTWGQCDWNWFFIAISAQWLCDIIYIYISIYTHTHIYIFKYRLYTSRLQGQSYINHTLMALWECQPTKAQCLGRFLSKRLNFLRCQYR